jgi:ABC-type multidrug transport system permease subunit
LLLACNSWGLVFAAPMVGARLVLPGPFLDGASMHRLMEEQGVTHTAVRVQGVDLLANVFVFCVLCAYVCMGAE